MAIRSARVPRLSRDQPQPQPAGFYPVIVKRQSCGAPDDPAGFADFRCMVIRMDKKKVTMSLPTHTIGAAQEAARRSGTDFSAFAARALRNETLRTQLAATPLPEITGWLDDAEQDEAGAA